MKILHIDSSVLGEHSVSRQLTRDVVAEWEKRHPDLELTYRDLAAFPPSHLSADTVAARQLPVQELNAAQRGERHRRGAGERVPRRRCHRHRSAHVQFLCSFPAEGVD